MSVLLIEFLLDNSLSMDKERIFEFQKELENFNQKLKDDGFNGAIKTALISYGDFSPIDNKTFDEDKFKNDIQFGCIPFYNRLLKRGIEMLNAEVERMLASGIELYKPWIVSITGPKNYDLSSDASILLKEQLIKGKVTFFPFKTCVNVDSSFRDFQMITPFLQLKSDSFKDMFEWVFEMAERRARMIEASGLKLTKEDMEKVVVLK